MNIVHEIEYGGYIYIYIYIYIIDKYSTSSYVSVEMDYIIPISVEMDYIILYQ